MNAMLEYNLWANPLEIVRRVSLSWTVIYQGGSTRIDFDPRLSRCISVWSPIVLKRHIVSLLRSSTMRLDIFRDGCRQITWLLVLGQLVRVSRAPVTQIVIWIVAYQKIYHIEPPAPKIWRRYNPQIRWLDLKSTLVSKCTFCIVSIIEVSS